MKKNIVILCLILITIFTSCKQEINTPNGSLTNTSWSRQDDGYASMTEELEFKDSYLSAKLVWGGPYSSGTNFVTMVNGNKLYLNTWGKATPSTSSYDSVYSFTMDKTNLLLTYSGGAVIQDLAGKYTKK